MVSGVYQKPHKKMAAPKFLFLWSELILCNISPFFFFFLVERLSLILVERVGSDAFKLIFIKGPHLRPHSVVLFTHPVVVLQSEGRLSCGWNRSIHLSSDCPHREKATPGLSVHVEPVWRLAALRHKDIGWCTKPKQIISDESNLRASSEAAVRCDNTVLLMLYKWRDLF